MLMVVARILLPPFIIYIDDMSATTRIAPRIPPIIDIKWWELFDDRLLPCKDVKFIGILGFGAAREPFEEFNLKISNPLSKTSSYLEKQDKSFNFNANLKKSLNIVF